MFFLLSRGTFPINLPPFAVIFATLVSAVIPCSLSVLALRGQMRVNKALDQGTDAVAR